MPWKPLTSLFPFHPLFCRVVSAIAPPTTAVGGRKLLTSKPRSLLGTDGSPTVTPSFVYDGALCPETGNTPYTDVLDPTSNGYNLGQLVLDNGACVRTTAGRGQVVTTGGATGVVSINTALL